MGKVVAVFNTKGGVGKSTTVMMLADALSAYENQKVFVIDGDPQTSVSIMMTPKHDGVPNHLKEKCWDWAENNKCTIVDFFTHARHQTGPPPMQHYTIGAVSDVVGAHTIDLMPGNMELALFETEMIEAGEHEKLDEIVQMILQTVRVKYDVVLIDCPPGVTPLSMLWLQHADAYLPPATPNYLGIRGLAVTERLRERFAQNQRRFARSLGTIITLDPDTISAQSYKQEIRARDEAAGIMPFRRQVPRLSSVQYASEYDTDMRTFAAKYRRTFRQNLPLIVRDIAGEVLNRIR